MIFNLATINLKSG